MTASLVSRSGRGAASARSTERAGHAPRAERGLPAARRRPGSDPRQANGAARPARTWCRVPSRPRRATAAQPHRAAASGPFRGSTRRVPGAAFDLDPRGTPGPSTPRAFRAGHAPPRRVLLDPATRTTSGGGTGRRRWHAGGSPRLAAEQSAALAAGRPAVGGEAIIALAEQLLSPVRQAVWLDRAEAVVAQLETISLRELRATVLGAAPHDEHGRELLGTIREALKVRLAKLRVSWEGDITRALDEGRVLHALRLSARPPDPAARIPSSLSRAVERRCRRGAHHNELGRPLARAARGRGGLPCAALDQTGRVAGGPDGRGPARGDPGRGPDPRTRCAARTADAAAAASRRGTWRQAGRQATCPEGSAGTEPEAPGGGPSRRRRRRPTSQTVPPPRRRLPSPALSSSSPSSPRARSRPTTSRSSP